MHKSVSKIYGNLWENDPKMMQQLCPNSMTNLRNFGTCDFLFFVKSIALKSFFHMIRGTKSMQNQCKYQWNIDARKRGAKIMNSAPKGRQNGSRNREKNNKHVGSKNIIFGGWMRGGEPTPGGCPGDARGMPGGHLGGSLLIRFNTPTVKHGQ